MTLKINNLAIGYKSKPVSSGICLEARSGETVALLGQNGVGKSTLIKSIVGDIPKISGDVFLDSQDLSRISRRELAKKIAIVTTDRTMADDLTVREIVSLGRQPFTGWTDRLTSADHDLVETVIRETGIAHKADSKYRNLSDGEKQKTMIARALAQDTPVLILDEPFAFLDVAARVEILGKLKRIASERQKIIIFSSHDVAQALRMADIIWLMRPDSTILAEKPLLLIESGEINSLFANPNIHFDPVQNDFIC